MNIQIHPSAAKFPPLEGEAFDGLVEDIRTNGLREKIVFRFLDSAADIESLDGRNRLRVVEKLGFDLFPDGKPNPQYFREYDEAEDGDIDAFIMSVNLHRRHLTPAQQREAWARKREAIAARLKADPSQTNATIVADLDVHFRTVEQVRGHLVATGEIPDREQVTTADGRVQPTAQAAKNRRAVIAAMLRENPAQTNTSIGESVGCDRKIVAVVRKELLAAGDIPPVTEVIGRDGKSQSVKSTLIPAKPTTLVVEATETEALPEAPLPRKTRVVLPMPEDDPEPKEKVDPVVHIERLQRLIPDVALRRRAVRMILDMQSIRESGDDTVHMFMTVLSVVDAFGGDPRKLSAAERMKLIETRL